MKYICPVCGYDELTQEPYPYHSVESHEICPSCSFHFGYDDESEGFTHKQWRERWIKEGMKWWSSREKPANWDPKLQLLNIGIKI